MESTNVTKKYLVTFREVHRATFEVEAASERDAYNIANRRYENGEEAALCEYDYTQNFDADSDIEVVEDPDEDEDEDEGDPEHPDHDAGQSVRGLDDPEEE